MSCEKNGARAATAGVSAGVAKLNNKMGNVTGAILSRAQQADGSALADRVDAAIDAGGRLMAPAANVATNALKAAGRLETKGLKRVAGVASLLVPEARMAATVVKKVEAVSSLAGDVAGSLSRQEDVDEVMQEKRTMLFFKSQTPVTLWKSSLTDVINRGDVAGTSRFTGKNIAASEGVMFRMGNKTWHRGTTQVDMPGGRRTITHLQAMSLPSSHYYFDRPLSNENAVELAAGKVKPESVPGYVGQVSSLESLCTGWSQAKHAMLKTRLHWPPGG